jgi:hypothetical protein
MLKVLQHTKAHEPNRLMHLGTKISHVATGDVVTPLRKDGTPRLHKDGSPQIRKVTREVRREEYIKVGDGSRQIGAHTRLETLAEERARVNEARFQPLSRRQRAKARAGQCRPILPGAIPDRAFLTTHGTRNVIAVCDTYAALDRNEHGNLRTSFKSGGDGKMRLPRGILPTQWDSVK